MKREVPLFVLVLLIVLLLSVLGFVTFHFSEQKTTQPLVVPQNTEKTSTTGESFVIVGGEKVEVDLANTPATRTRGLSGRDPLQKGEGMLFVFETSNQYGFWMKDMKFAIDIIWMDTERNIVHIEKSLSPDTYPKVFTPSQPAKYVLEVQAGFSERTNLKVGDNIEFSQNF